MATTKAERRRTVMNTQNFDPSLIADPPSGPAAAPTPAPPAMSTNAPASKAAPPRSSAPRQSAQSVSSTASNSSSRQPSQKTLDQVLAAANPPGDVNAALAALLEERNSVAQQNAQLWRIIEKQKSSLATATKDLERIRAERERYRRLFEETTAASGSGSELERRHARSRSSSKMPQGARAVSQSRAPMSRHQSDDVVPRAPSHDGPSHLNGHSGGSDSRLDEIVQQPLLADRDATLQSSRLPARSESLPVASNISAASSKTSLAASSVAGDTATPPSQPTSALEPPSDSNALSVRASKRGARESRITSAEEVQKYISGMEQSLPPAPDGSAMPGSTSASRQLPVPPPQASVLPAVAAISPMNFDSTFAQRMTPPTQPVPVQQTPPNRGSDQDYSKTPTQTNIGFVAPPPPPPLPNAHARAAPEPYNDTDDDFSADGHSSTVYSPADSNSRQGIPMIIRNAPSMTSMNVHANLQSNQAASLHSSVPDDSTLFESSPIATSPTTSTTSTPPPYLQPTYQPPSQAQPPKMARTESQQTTTTINPPKLTPFDMSTAIITVPLSHIRANDRGKEVLSFVIEIALDPMSEREGWKIEKLYSDVLALDGRVRQVLSRSALKKIAPLPDAKLFRDNAPAKVDQRKVMLQTYLSTVLAAPWKNPADVTGFFTSDVILHARAPVSHPGYKEGYLTKRGKNFGGWKTRYFVLQSPVLEYYESRGGAHLGSISLAGSQIGRQQRQASRDAEDENAYRHAFLIIEGKRGPSGALNRHVLCAESDEERDSWVEVLVRYVVGEYDKHGDPSQTQSQSTQAPSRASTSSFQDPPRRTRAMSKDEILKGNALPISQLAPDASNAKLFQAPPPPPELAPSGGPQGSAPIPIDGAVKQIMDPAQDIQLSSSLPSHLDVAMGGDGAAAAGGQPGQRSNSELGHYPDMPPPRKPNRASYHPSAAQAPRPPSPDKVKISGPINGVPIPAGKYGGKDWDVSNPGPSANNDRERKAKSGRFWGFGKAPSDKPPVAVPAAPVGRAVFGIPLQESLAIAQIANLPAIVFRCIEYLEAKRADQEEGIYRLSGSSAVIKSLKDKFNAEGDVHLLESEEYWDPHAVAGLLKSFLRELPSSILTRELHLSFLAVIDLADPQERVSELASLIAQLPIANYSLLRALTAHLILIVQNSNVNKMTMRNVGIVFSPTLGIPAGVFSLMLNEFNRVFSVEAESSTEAAPVSASTPVEEKLVIPSATDTSSASARGKRGMSDPSRRNSRSYNEAHADKLLGLGGRTLKVDEESDEDDDAIEDNDNDSEAETDHSGLVAGSPSEVAPAGSLHQRLEPPTNDSAHRGHSAAVAASRGLQIAPPGPGGHRRTASGMGPGLPQSPRPAGRLPGSPAHSTGSPATPRT